MNNQFLYPPWWVERSNTNNYRLNSMRHSLDGNLESTVNYTPYTPTNNKNLSLGYASSVAVYILAVFLLYPATACGGQSTVTPVNPTHSPTATRTINTPTPTQRPTRTLEATIAEVVPTATPI